MTSRFLFFAGKGGVGKTTCAAAYAVAAARRGARVLLVSTDPAHSLGDALGRRLSARVSAVAVGRRRIDAVELDAPRALVRWMREHGRALGDILEQGTWLDRDDVEALLGLPVPGVDELVGLIEIVRMAGAAAAPRRARAGYDLVVVDTAPTGHTLHLLASPATVAAVAEALDALHEPHRVIREQLARVIRPEAADHLIALLAEQARDTGALLRDARRAGVRWVLQPDALSVAESEDGLRALERAGMAVDELIVNRVTRPGRACPVCDRRRAAERTALARLPRRLGTRRVRLLEATPREPRGIAALAAIGRTLLTPAPRPRATGRARRAPARVSGPAYSSAGAAHTPPEAIAALGGARLLLFGGKGGVGKTTCAAAAAIRLARADPSSRVLLLSTDPAHSLGDVFEAAIGDRAAPIKGAPPNLQVRELDARAVLAAHRRDLETAMDEIAAALGSGADQSSTRAAELMELAPPGIDELLGIVSIAESLAPAGGGGRGAAGTYDLAIVDTAPTGHALRLLEMPEAARGWVQVLLRVLLKYRELAHPGTLAAELVDLSRSIRGLQALLRSARDARFVVVTRAAAVVREETGRLLARLGRLRLAAPAVVVNALTLAPGACPWCRAVAAAERRELAALTRRCRRRARGCAIIVTPLAAPPPRGTTALDRWATLWSA